MRQWLPFVTLRGPRRGSKVAVSVNRVSREGYRDPRADALRERYHTLFGGDELPVPVEAIAEDLLGLIVEEAALDVSGMLFPATREIYINAAEPPARRRFTLAHELGHWICQCLEGRTAPVYCRAADVDAAADRSLEREANIFAAELLMPESAVRLHWGGDIEAVASHFAVSANAASWRLYSFRLTGERPT